MTDHSLFLEVDHIYLGAHAETLIASDVMLKTEKREVKQSCRQYYIELCNQILKRIDFDDSTLLAMEIINPNNFGRTLTQLMKLYPNIVDTTNIEDINNEWRMLLCDTNIKKTDDLEAYWNTIFSIKNVLNENMYPNLKLFLAPFLSLPHSSATVERIFSQLTLIKDKKRNILHTGTVNAIMASKELLSIQEAEASTWVPSHII